MPWILYRANRFWRRRRWARLALSLLILVLGAGTTFVAAGAHRTLSMADRYERRFGGDFDVALEQFEGGPTPDAVRSLPSVRSVESATFVFGLLTSSRGDPVDTLIFYGDQKAFGSRMLAGRNPANVHEFAASQDFFTRTKARLGDRFRLVTLNEEQGQANGFDLPPDQWAGPQVEATLVGRYGGAANLQDGYANAIFPDSLADQGSLGIAATEYGVGLRPGTRTADLRRELDTLPNGKSFGVSSAKLVPDPVRQSISARGEGILILGIVVGLAALAVTGQLLFRQVRVADAERRVLLGLGGTRRQMVLDPTMRAVLAVLPLLVLGGGLAYALSGAFPLGFTKVAEPTPGALFDTTHVWVPVTWGLLLVLWVATTAARVAARPVRAGLPAAEHLARMSPDPRPAMGTRFAFTRARVGGSVTGPLVGLSLVAAGAITALIFGATVDRVIDEPARYGAYDAQIGQGGDTIDPTWIAALKRSRLVKDFILGDNISVSVDSKQVNVASLKVLRGSYDPTVFEGRAPASRDEIMLGQLTAREFGVGVGDPITLDAPAGKVRLRVSGIGVTNGIDGGNGAGEGGVVTAEAGRRLTKEGTYGSGEVDLVDGATPADLEKETDGVVQVDQASPPGVIVNLTYVRGLPALIMWVLVGLALLGVGHQLLLSAHHRSRDHGILRSMGADRGWSTTVVHWHAMLWTTAMVAIAIPVGIVLGRIVAHAFIGRIGAQPDPNVPLGTVFLIGLGLVVLANLVALLPGHRARHTPVTTALVGE